MNFLILKDFYGNDVMVNVDDIQTVAIQDRVYRPNVTKSTKIQFRHNNEYIWVQETPAEVYNQIQTYLK